jgi:hypothetical protein
MDRRNFMSKSFFAGIGCSCVGALNTKAMVAQTDKFTPCNEKMDFVKVWTERFFTVLDQHVDEKTRTAIMRHNGRLCHDKGKEEVKEYKPRSFEEIDKSLKDFQKYTGEGNPKREGNTIFFHYVSNPRGLLVSDGYCLCPMVEDGPAKLSPTFCQCSAGYVEQVFKEITGRKVEVILLESIRSGGKTCSFKIEILN